MSYWREYRTLFHFGLSDGVHESNAQRIVKRGYRTFKGYYQRPVAVFLKGHFQQHLSYQRFIELMPHVLLPLTLFMQQRCQTGHGIAFIDSTSLKVCENLRIPHHHTFRENAGWGKSSTGWFYDFKLHWVVDDCGNILSFALTSGNTDNRKPVPTLRKLSWAKSLVIEVIFPKP